MESAKSKNPREIKPISDVANRQSHAHLSSCGFDGEEGIRTLVEVLAPKTLSRRLP